MKQTAVEWLLEELVKGDFDQQQIAIKQAKKIEKKQIMDAWLTKKQTTFGSWKNEFEQYYKETFNK